MLQFAPIWGLKFRIVDLLDLDSPWASVNNSDIAHVRLLPRRCTGEAQHVGIPTDAGPHLQDAILGKFDHTPGSDIGTSASDRVIFRASQAGAAQACLSPECR
ncbi:hypothetical protein [Salipiger aestuarii]|nr:hypothetical protein [Salipiger aestuarii]KAA8608373.1 hypothetical protein AL037_17050 [Salipiger aestuarii]